MTDIEEALKETLEWAQISFAKEELRRYSHAARIWRHMDPARYATNMMQQVFL